MAAIFFNDGFRRPRSMPLTYVRSRPQRCANSSWERPRNRRSSRTRRPNACCTSNDIRQHRAALKPLSPRTLRHICTCGAQALASWAMTDNLSRRQRSRCMSRIRSRGNASTEQRLIEILQQARITGWRRHPDLPGNPDFVFRRERVVVFVDGCLWHRCPRCFRMPKSNVEYWARKIGRNVRRDRRNNRELRRRGWKVVRIWEHSLRQPHRVASRLRRALTIGYRDRDHLLARAHTRSRP